MTNPEATTRTRKYEYRLAPYDALTIQVRRNVKGAAWQVYMPRRYDEADALHVLSLLYSNDGEKMVMP